MKKIFCDLCLRHITMLGTDYYRVFHYGFSTKEPLELCDGCYRILMNTVLNKMDEIRKENKNEYSGDEERDLDSLSSLDTGESDAGESDCGNLPVTSVEGTV